LAGNLETRIQATRGTIFWAPAETGLPTEGVKAFTLAADNITADGGAWTNFGDTSNDNKLSFSADGGDATVLATWRDPAARTVYADTEMTVTAHSVNAGKESLRMIYNGWDGKDGHGIIGTAAKREKKLALFILAHDSGAGVRFGIYLPNVSFVYSNDGFVDVTGEGFVEFGFEAKVLTSTSLPTNPETGDQGSFALYEPAEFVDGVAISFSAPTAEVKVGASVNVVATASNTSDAVVYESDNAAIATVDTNGKVTGVKAGTATITATAGGVSATMEVTVTAA
jgi:uncharacterized protein YjdB